MMTQSVYPSFAHSSHSTSRQTLSVYTYISIHFFCFQYILAYTIFPPDTLYTIIMFQLTSAEYDFIETTINIYLNVQPLF